VDVTEPEMHGICLGLDVDVIPMWQIFVEVVDRENDGEKGGGGHIVEIDRVVGPRNVELLRDRVLDLAINGFDSTLYEDI
jgi:hypothetical protein